MKSIDSDFLCKRLKSFWKVTEGICAKCINPEFSARNKKAKRKMGCCLQCAETHGYLTGPHAKALEKKYKFSKKTGYFREGKGCKLPRKHRSLVCLAYLCGEIITKLYISEYERGRLAEVLDLIKDLRGY